MPPRPGTSFIQDRKPAKGATRYGDKPITKYVGGPMARSYENARGTLVANPDWRPPKGAPVVTKRWNPKTKKYG